MLTSALLFVFTMPRLPAWGNVLLLLDEKRNEDAAAAAYETAAGCKPLDAMEALDAAWARDQLE